MNWSGDDFEKGIKSFDFFKCYGFVVVCRKIRKPGTSLEQHIVYLENSCADRSIEITFFPSHSPEKTSISNLYIVKTSTDDGFNLKDYLKQYHNVEIDSNKFRYTNYSGTFEEKVRGFLEFVTELLERYAIPILQGTEWPEVNFDWQGYR